MPEMTTMPDLMDLTIRQALSSLKNSGLKIRQLLYMQNMADNAVLGQYYYGDTLNPGDELLSGSEIDLLIGRSNNNPSPVPFLLGRGEDAAIDLLHISSLNVGRITYWDSIARKDGKVYRQSPRWTDQSGKGEKVDFWLRSASQLDFDSLIQTLLPDSILVQEKIPEILLDSVIFEE
jgi:beta-lactam-binding protein with PASTA domain